MLTGLAQLVQLEPLPLTLAGLHPLAEGRYRVWWGPLWQVAFCSVGGQFSEGVTVLTLTFLLENVSAAKRPAVSSSGDSHVMAKCYESMLALLQFFLSDVQLLCTFM